MSYDNGGRPARPAPRSSRPSSSAPMGSTVAIVVTAIAVLLAFFILRKVNESGETSTADPVGVETTASTLAGDTTATSATVAVSTTTPFTKIGTSVQVINVSNQNGVARNLSNALAAEGFTMVEPDSGTIDSVVTKVIYNPDDPLALPVAQSVAILLGNVVVEASGAVVPSEATGTWVAGSSVAVLLGNDLAGKTLAQIAGGETTGVTTATTTTTTTA